VDVITSRSVTPSTESTEAKSRAPSPNEEAGTRWMRSLVQISQDVAFAEFQYVHAEQLHPSARATQ
jgi:peroxiredoxin